MSCADAIAGILRDAHFTNYFTKVSPSALDCAEPIVVLDGEFKRDARLVEEERGTVPVSVLVVREVSADAEDVATAAERAVRRADWELYADAGAYRIVGIDTTVPAYEGDDASGRAVWSFKATCTVVRGL